MTGKTGGVYIINVAGCDGPSGKAHWIFQEKAFFLFLSIFPAAGLLSVLNLRPSSLWISVNGCSNFCSSWCSSLIFFSTWAHLILVRLPAPQLSISDFPYWHFIGLNPFLTLLRMLSTHLSNFLARSSILTCCPSCWFHGHDYYYICPRLLGWILSWFCLSRALQIESSRQEVMECLVTHFWWNTWLFINHPLNCKWPIPCKPALSWQPSCSRRPWLPWQQVGITNSTGKSWRQITTFQTNWSWIYDIFCRELLRSWGNLRWKFMLSCHTLQNGIHQPEVFCSDHTYGVWQDTSFSLHSISDIIGCFSCSLSEAICCQHHQLPRLCCKLNLTFASCLTVMLLLG